MDVKETIINKPVNNVWKVTTCKPESALRDLINAGPKIGKTQMSMVDDILQTQLTTRSLIGCYIWIQSDLSVPKGDKDMSLAGSY